MKLSALLLATLALVFVAAPAPAAKDKPPVPDFTKGEAKGAHHDWTLGPTGARGWIWAWKQQTTDARQILVTEVAPGSPADGVLRVGDVLLGVNGQPFTDDARVVFARAITESEKGGALGLVRWRDAKSENVELKLPALGAYAATAPYDCAKSARIFEEGCAAIARKGFKDKRGKVQISIPHDLNALALLASGRAEYQPLVAEYATAVAAHEPGGHKSWGYAYGTLFLAEYAAATKDTSVMPGLTRLATDIAKGASSVGTWGHNFARPEDGILNGYGCMNQPGIVLTLAMLAAREAGVKSPVLDATIARSARFLRWFAGKGAIPYGDHAPWPDHEDNGKCSSAALMFDFLGEREPAAFFSRMATAAHMERESGHTGNFFNMLWALPGVARSGPLATAAYFHETAWLYDFARKWDGSFQHQGIPGERESYDKWDTTGAYLLAYALPRKSLLVTGRKPSVVPALTAAEVAETIESGRWNWWNGLETYYTPRSTEELMRALESWSSTVRARAAKALVAKPGVSVPALIATLDAERAETRYGACVALRHLGDKADAAAPKLRALLASDDPWQRVLAAEAIVEMSQPVREAAIPDLLRVLIRKGDPEDPRRCVMGPLAEVLFKPAPGRREPDSILRKSFEPVEASDRPLLIAAIREVMHSEDGRIRGGAGAVYGLLTPKELASLMPDILETIRKPAPSGEMFAYDIRMTGLELLGRLRIREGMELALQIMNEWRWGRDLRRATRALAAYGGHARPLLPRIQEVRATLAEQIKTTRTPNPDRQRELEELDKLISKIETDAAPKPTLTAAEFIKDPPTADLK